MKTTGGREQAGLSSLGFETQIAASNQNLRNIVTAFISSNLDRAPAPAPGSRRTRPRRRRWYWSGLCEQRRSARCTITVLHPAPMRLAKWEDLG
jgi:hypothetical protein